MSTFNHNAMVLPPAMGDHIYTPAEFETLALAFQQGQLASDVFLDICTAALNRDNDPSYERLIYRNRYLAYLVLGDYYQARAEARTVLSRFNDQLLYQEMLCVIFLKRRNYYRALECMDRIIEKIGPGNANAGLFMQQRQEIQSVVDSVISCSAEEFRQAVAAAGQDAGGRYGGRLLRISGPASFALVPGTGNLYIVFRAGQADGLGIYGQAPGCEIPFLRHCQAGQQLSVLGVFLGIDQRNILLTPCHVLD